MIETTAVEKLYNDPSEKPGPKKRRLSQVLFKFVDV